MPKQYLYRGYTVEQLQQMSMDDFIRLLPSKSRRKMLRGLPTEHRNLLEALRMLRRAGSTRVPLLKTHNRDMIILPEMVGVTLGIHNGKEFVNVEIKPEMVGHILGEFTPTSKKVMHGNPGIGASRSSMYVPLK